MKDNIFFDTNIIVYLFDKSEDKKHRIAKEIFNQTVSKCNPYISVQVINEFIVIASQKIKKPLPLREVKKRVDFLSDTLNIIALELATCNLALELKLKYKLSYWDSLIIASAQENECEILYTEDMHDGLVINNELTIRNPFL